MDKVITHLLNITTKIKVNKQARGKNIKMSNIDL